MIPIGQLIVTTAEAVGEVFNRKKPVTPARLSVSASGGGMSVPRYYLSWLSKS